jgi:hypothetical protein
MMAWPKNEELAVLTMNGASYRDWTSVMVKHALKDHPWITYHFTCSEGMPLARNWSAMRIVPGMECTVTLAGQPAVKGLVCQPPGFHRQPKTKAELHEMLAEAVRNTQPEPERPPKIKRDRD